MTDVPLRQHIEAQIAWLDRHVETKIRAIERATEIALTTLNERLAGMNEFRMALKDQVSTFAGKDEMERRLSIIEGNQARAEGRAAVIGFVAGIVAAGVVSFVVRYV